MDTFNRSVSSIRSQQGPLILALASLGVGYALKSVLSSSLDTRQQKVIPSPRKTQLPNLSLSEIEKLPYPPNALPGARDVETPYGSTRVYEWGSEEGQKVLFVHGISNPCIVFGGLAHGLVAKGYRVMLFDLWGRGYSDAPANLKYDERLYATQILSVLSSSPLSWTGEASGGFSLIGYSLGGGIAASFTSHFPELVRSLVLLAPAGLLRAERTSVNSKLLYSAGILPESLIERLVKRRLKVAPIVALEKQDPTKSSDPALQELAEQPQGGNAPPAPSYDVSRTLEWQLDSHEGFASAFISSIRYGPVTDQHANWRAIGSLLSKNHKIGRHLGADKVLIVLGNTDQVIIRDEVKADATAAFGGDENVVVKIVDAGHELPITKSEEIVGCIQEVWN